MRRVTRLWQLPLGATLSCLLGTACSASTRTAEVTDCNAAAAYELSTLLRTFEVSNEDWFSGGDPTGSTTKPVIEALSAECSTGGTQGAAGSTSTGAAAGTGGAGGSGTGSATLSVAIQPIEDAGRCGSLNALVLRSSGHTDWGSVFGDWRLASAPGTAFCDNCGPWDGTGYEGIAFWARSSDNGDKSVTLLLDTWQTSSSGTENVDPALVCKFDCSAGSGTRSRDEAGNVTSQTYVSPPGSCGNSFQRLLSFTSDWQFYVVPFSSFYQELKPNLSADGVNPAHINGLSIRPAKEASVEIWLDDISFYRRK